MKPQGECWGRLSVRKLEKPTHAFANGTQESIYRRQFGQEAARKPKGCGGRVAEKCREEVPFLLPPPPPASTPHSPSTA